MPVAAISPGTVDHWLRCTTAALDLGETYGHDRVLTERDIVSREILEERPMGKIRFGRTLDHGNQRSHRPDLIVAAEEGLIAVEVELTPKAPGRLADLLRAWRSAVGSSEFLEVRYLCEPGQTRHLVERVVKKVRCEEFIQIGEAPER